MYVFLSSFWPIWDVATGKMNKCCLQQFSEAIQCVLNIFDYIK